MSVAKIIQHILVWQITQSIKYCFLARTAHHQVRQGAHLQGGQGYHQQGHQAAGRHAPHSHFNSLRRLAPLLPFPPVPRHHHKHKQELHRVQSGSKAHQQSRHNNGKKNGAAAKSQTKVTPSFLRLPAERMPGYQTFQLHEVIPRNFQEVAIYPQNCAIL